jgi:protease I
MKALIVAADGVQDVEFAYPFYRLQEAGFTVDVAVPYEFPGYEGDGTWARKILEGIGGLRFDANRGLPIIGTPRPDLLVIPGGVKAMEKLRLEMGTLDFIADCHRNGAVIASICSGAQMLISAGLVKGRRIAAYPAMRIDVENAGGAFVDGVVADDRIVTAPHYRDLGPWMAAALAQVGLSDFDRFGRAP